MAPFFSQWVGQSGVMDESLGKCSLKEIDTKYEGDNKAVLTYKVTLTSKDGEKSSFETSMDMKKVEDKWYIANTQKASSNTQYSEPEESKLKTAKKEKDEIKPSFSKVTVTKEPFAESTHPFTELNIAWYREVGATKYSLINEKGEILQKILCK